VLFVNLGVVVALRRSPSVNDFIDFEIVVQKAGSRLQPRPVAVLTEELTLLASHFAEDALFQLLVICANT